MSAKKPKAEDPLSPVTTRLPLDWDQIQDLYRANKISVREIGSMFGVSHVSILKRAKACEWARDLDAKINARAEQIVARRTVTSGVTSESSPKQVVTKARIVEINAKVIANVRMRHRTHITRFRILRQKRVPPKPTD